MKDGGEFTWNSGFNAVWSTFAFFYSLWCSHSQNTGVVCHSLFHCTFLNRENDPECNIGLSKMFVQAFPYAVMEYFNILGKIEAVWVKKMERFCRCLTIWKIQMQGCHVFASESSLSGFPHSSVGKESACNAEDPGSIPGSGRSTGEGIGYPLQYSWVSLVAQLVKNPPAMWETWVRSLGWEVPLEKGKATHSSIWPGEFHGLYSPWGPKELDMIERL